MRVDANSNLSFRIMKEATRLPLNHPEFKKEVLEKICKPNGYVEVRKHRVEPLQYL
jgi:hypothetical protein